MLYAGGRRLVGLPVRINHSISLDDRWFRFLSLQQWLRPLPISTSLPPAIFPLRREAAQIDSLSSLRFRSQTREKKKKDSSFLHELSASRPTGKRQRPTLKELKRNQMLPISIPFVTRFANLVSSPRKELLVGESFPLYLPSLLCTQGSERRKRGGERRGRSFSAPFFSSSFQLSASSSSSLSSSSSSFSSTSAHPTNGVSPPPSPKRKGEWETVEPSFLFPFIYQTNIIFGVAWGES